MSYLKTDEYLPYAPDTVGTIHVHHCKDGQQNDRLYITRRDNGDVVAYCHHCGKSGYHREAFSRVKRSKKCYSEVQNIARCNDKLLLPRDSTSEIADWPAKASIWIHGAGIKQDTAKKYGIVYSEYWDRVIIPVHKDGDLVGYQARNLLRSSSEPKYVTITNDREHMFWIGDKVTDNVCVICEDVLSAIRCNKFVSSVALLGTKLSDYGLNYLSQFSEFIVWLDNDNPEVKKSQMSIKRRLSIFGKTRIIKVNKEPKHMSDEEIKKCLNL